MRDLGMELDAAQQAVAGANGGIWRIAAMRDRLQRRRYRFDAVAVTHPYRKFAIGETVEQFVALVDHQFGGPVLALAGARAMRAQMLRDHVQSVADSQHRASDAQNLGRDVRRVGLIEARGTARKNDSARAHRADLCDREIVRMNLAIDLGLAHAASDELRVLAAEIQNEDH